MSKLFLHLLNISITAGWIVLVVVLLRFVLKKAPKWVRVVLWGLVALRLLLPVSIESVTSLVPSAETVKVESVTAPVLTSVNEHNGVSYFYKNVRGEQIVLQSGFPTLNSAVNPTPEEAAEHFDTVAVLKTVAGWVWLIGVVGMLFYALISFLRLKHRVRASVLLEKGVYVCDEIRDPFILGLLFPKIYLPSGMDEQTRAYVLSHERAHLKRFDHIWKPLGFLLLSVYWFNPLLWLAYILLCRDIELACDEKVIKDLSDDGKAAYSEALITASVSRRSIAACPLAFGETGVKSRVKSVLNYKKPAFWIILVAILAGIIVAVCFLTVPKINNIDITESDRTLILHAQTIEDSPNNYADPTSFHPVLTDKGMFHKAIIDGKHCLSFRTNDEREIHLLDGFAGNIQYHSPYVYATIAPDNWKELPKLYRIDLRNGSVEAFAEKVQIEYVYADGYVLWWSPSDKTLYLSDWHGNNRQKVHENKGLSMIPTPNGIYMYGDGSVYLYERNRAFRKLYTSTTEGKYISECYYANENLYLLIQNTNGSGIVTVARLNTDGTLTEICSIDNFNDLYSNSRTQLFLLPNDLLDALKEWSKRSIVFEKEIASGITLFGIKSDRIVRIYSYRNAIVYVNVDDYQEFVILVSASDAENMQWLDYYSEMPWDGTKEITHDAFPNVTFRWTTGSVEAVESGRTRTLFSGMPVWSVYFADLTGDGKPDLCATVSFGSGIVDEHIIVYDYANKQSYVLWDRMQFDFHLYTVDGALYVGKTPYMGDKQVDSGTLELHDGVLSCRWQSDGSYTVLYHELHESELIGKWLVEEETDNDGNVLYTFAVDDLWKEYNFREDGTVVYNETIPVSSDYEKAFGHPVEYPYEVHNDCVYIAGDDTSGAFRWGQYDRETHRLMLSYNTAERTVYQTLKRMGEPETSNETELDETTLCTTWMLVEIEAPDGSNGDARALGLEQYLVFRSNGTVRIVDRDGQGYIERIASYTRNGNTVRYDDTVLRYDSEDRELVLVDAATQDIYFYTPTPNAVLPETTPQPELTYVGTWELYTAASFYQEYSSALLDALDLSYTIILQEDGTGTEIIPDDSESKEISIQYTADGNSLTITLMNPETNAAMISYSAVYDPQNDSLVLEDLFETYRYLRKGANKPAYLREITLDTIVGTWETGGIQVVANADPVLNGTIEFRENQTATWTMNGLGENTGNEEFPFSLDGNLIRISQEGEIEIGSFLVYDSLSDTIQFPIMNIGVLTYTRKQANEQSEAGTPANSAVIDRALIGTWELIRAEDSAPEMAAGIKTINEQIAAGNYIMTYRFTENGDAEVYLKSDGSGTYHYTYTTENGTIVFIDNSNRTVWSYSFDEDLLLLSKGTYTQVFRRVAQ